MALRRAFTEVKAENWGPDWSRVSKKFKELMEERDEETDSRYHS